ncbi:MAG: ABC transporter permease, partial [Planctomycetota bacterium]
VSLYQLAWRRLRRNRRAMGSVVFLLLISAAAFFAPLLPLQSPLDKDLKNRVAKPPSMAAFQMGARKDLRFKDNSLVSELAAFRDRARQAKTELLALRDRNAPPDAIARQEELIAAMEQSQHPFRKLWHEPDPLTMAMCKVRVAVFGDYAIPSLFGTDQLGRDVLSRVFWGARVSILVGIIATMVSLAIGVSYGATAGYFGGVIDAAMMRVVDVLYSVPFIFLVIFAMTLLGEDSVRDGLQYYGIQRIHIFYVLIGAVFWLTMSRVVRGQVISLRQEQFVEAAIAVGATPQRIIFRHLVPNVLGVVIVYLTLTIPAVMLFEAFLSFLGLGVSAPDVSWGLLVNEGVESLTPVRIFWWLVLFPGLALASTLFALNFLGDGLRDALDTKMKD